MLLRQGELERWNVPGLAVGVLNDGKTELWGYGDVRPDSRLRVASITKSFTATLALGVLDLDRRALGEATVRQLLSNQSGLDFDLPHDMHRYGDGDDALAAAVADLHLVKRWAAPGELWAYSNAGFWVAGLRAAETLGTTFEEALAERVLRPLGLESTSFELEGAPSYPRARRPSGGLVSTVPDLLTYAASHLDDPVLRPAHEPIARMLGGGYGLGWGIRRYGEARTVFHGGSLPGFRSLLQLVPERRFAVAVLTKGNGSFMAARTLADRALESYLGLRREPPDFVEIEGAELEALAGHYRNPGFEQEVTPVDGGLSLASSESDPVVGQPVGPREFEIVTPGEDEGERFDFPRPGLLRFGLISERVD